MTGMVAPEQQDFVFPSGAPRSLLHIGERKRLGRGAFNNPALQVTSTTLIAAEKTGRRGYGIEIDPRYCDVTIASMPYAACRPCWGLLERRMRKLHRDAAARWRKF